MPAALPRQFPAAPRAPCRRESDSLRVAGAAEPVRDRREPDATAKCASGMPRPANSSPAVSGPGRIESKPRSPWEIHRRRSGSSVSTRKYELQEWAMAAGEIDIAVPARKPASGGRSATGVVRDIDSRVARRRPERRKASAANPWEWACRDDPSARPARVPCEHPAAEKKYRGWESRGSVPGRRTARTATRSSEDSDC